MRANLLSHKYKSDSELYFKISLTTGDIPYKGKIKVGLYCGYCEVVVTDKDIKSNSDGIVEGSFSLSGHTGPFSFNLTTPAGDSATVFLPGSRSDVREQIVISDMGETIMGGLLPDDSRPERIRGLYIGASGTKTTPIVIDNIVTDKAVLTFTEDLDVAAFDILSPVDGTFRQISRKKIKRGDKLEIETPEPFGFMFAAAMGKDCYQSFSLLIKPADMDLEIEMQEKAKPGEEIEITVKSNRKGHLMIVAADSRLQSDDPYDIFAEQYFKALKSGIAYAFSGYVEEYMPYTQIEKRRMGSGFAGAMPPPSVPFSSPAPMMMMGAEPVVYNSFAESSNTGALMDMQFEMDGLEMMAPPEAEPEAAAPPSTTRLDFPHLILAKLVEFDGEHTEKIKLGDQIGAFRIFAFLIDGFDFVSSQKQVETTQEIYLELDIPSLMSPGDEITGKIFAKCSGKGTIKVTSALSKMEKSVSGFGQYEIKLKSAGEVFGEISTPAGKDTTSKTIRVPGKETVTRSKIMWIKPGETVKSDKIIVYPNVGYLLQDAAKSLVQYPFGCAEQTSSKMFGLATVYRAMKKGIISNGFRDVERMLTEGADRMKLFYKDNSFSLWEGGTPADYVAIQVLSNLRPMWLQKIGEIDRMIESSTSALIKKNVKDNRLVEFNKSFATDMKTLKDAVSFYKQGADREKAVEFIKDKAVVSGETAYWKDDSCWAGATEATCLALQVMHKEDRVLFDKGFKYATSKLQDGRLYSTTDTAAFLELLDSLHGETTKTAIIDGKTINLVSAEIGKEVTATEETLIRIDEEVEVDYLTPCSNFKGEVKIERTSFKTGEKVNLVIKPLEESLAPLARIYLPGNAACLESGAGIQKMYLPIKGESLKLELYGVRKGRGKLQVALMDMYDAEKTGVLPGLTLTVS
jgi:hypothetical protein